MTAISGWSDMARRLLTAFLFGLAAPTGGARAQPPGADTVVDSNIDYPTDSSLLGDGVRLLTRTGRSPLA
jgi:hypothetical protein